MAEFTSTADALAYVRRELRLEADVEHEVIAELLHHLEDATADAMERGLSPTQALSHAVERLGLAETTTALRETHAGLGVREGVLAAALPVGLALTLRWLTYAPEGTAGGWRVLFEPQGLALLCGLSVAFVAFCFRRSRYALAGSAFFGAVSLMTALWPGMRW